MTLNIPPAYLTFREKQVIQGLAEGLTDRVIAKSLNRKPSTVRHYIGTAQKKVGATGRASLVNSVYDLGLLRLNVHEHRSADVPQQERELIPLLARSLTIRQMADETRRTPSQVARSIGQLMEILDARTRAHLMTRARQHGLLKTTPRPSTPAVLT
ncbi:LuxR C-terminal-related transcriptional regulator [Streptomyces venezuelae]|uniref:LuxR C-terminal-related transcriptional regulator n=1 Tax=Streptomyces venezuelae TaxID=54571 RepID=UPI00365FACBD